jgi:VWFA-related protein
MTTPLPRLRFASLFIALPLAFAAHSIASAAPVTKSPQSGNRSSQPQGMVLHMEVRRVPIDIVVTDQDGNPVKGLRKEDFTVKEDKKNQHILSFEYFDSAQSFIPPKLPPLPANTFIDLPGQTEQGPLYILYYDMVNTPPDDQMTFHKQLLDFVDKAAPGTRMAIFVNDSKLFMLQGFTSDHALLKAALLAKGPGPHIPDVFFDGRIYGQYNAGYALACLHHIADYMSGIPGRKNLLWLSSAFPIPVGATVTGVNSNAASIGGGFSNSATQINDLQYLLQKSIKETYDAFMRSQIALYPIAVGGIASVDQQGHAGDDLVQYHQMDAVAAVSGGHAYYANNHIGELIDKAITNGEDYYSISYEPTNQKYDGLERDIEITLPKKYNYTLSYRTVYYGVSDDELQNEQKPGTVEARAQAKKAEDTLYANIEHGAPMLHDLVFSAHLAPEGSPQLATPEQMLSLEDSPEYFRTRKHDKPLKPLPPIELQKYTIDYGVIDAELKNAAQRKGSPPTLEFVAAAYDVDGRLMNSMLNEGQITGQGSAQNAAQPTSQAQPAAAPQGVFHAIQELEVPSGASWIRLAVRDTLNNRTGTLEVHLPLKPEPTTASEGKPHPTPTSPTTTTAAAATPATN